MHSISSKIACQNIARDNYLSIAPMMERTDRHFRYFMRQITRRTLLYTEMITTAAILHGNRRELLDFSWQESPLALQVGGSDPKQLAECAIIARDWGYDEINLNVGCPSDRVRSGNFGACLMAHPEVVAKAVAAMQKAANIPVTVKHRIGIDDRDRYEDMVDFVRVVANEGCRRFIIHARKAWLKGLSPKENRDIPPLRYADVHRLKQEFPHLFIEINGGITTLEQARQQLEFVDAVMIGRAACDNPYLFARADRDFYGEDIVPPTRHEIVAAMLDYIDDRLGQGTKLTAISRHMLELFAGQPGTKAWKRHITENACLPGADSSVIRAALAKVPARSSCDRFSNSIGG